MRNYFYKLTALVMVSLFAMARKALAQIDPGIGPVPVPRNLQFGFFSPAGRSTATGLIISVIQILLFVIGALAVLFLIIGGFRYVTAEGSEERVESAKKTITNSIIGIIIVILSFVIINIIANALIFSAA